MAAQTPEFWGTLEHTLFTKPEDLHGEFPLAIGGKAVGLLRLHGAGAPVPPWVVLPADMAAHFDPDDAKIRRELDTLFVALSPGGEGVAVRSSGLTEDQSGASAAGIYETLFCTSAAELPKAIDAVLNSAHATRASAYRTGNDPGAMAVILQRRITPVFSGVAFSAHPNRARYDRVLIEAVLGECGALVDGTATPSRFEVDIESGAIAQVETGVQGPDQLDGEIVAELLGWLLKLEDAFDAALDIEWAADASGLWLLQARPITRVALDPSLRPPVAATSWFLDQRFHEPIHPITRSSLLPLIVRTGIEEALQLRGMAVPEPLTFDYGGQVYVPIEAYHRLLRNLPAWLITPDLRQLYPEGKALGRLPGPGLLWTGLPVLWRERERVLGNLRAWDRFRDGLGARLAAIPDADGDDAMVWYEAWTQLDALTEEFLCLHRWSIMLADYAYNAFLMLTRPLPRALREGLRQRLHGQVRLVTAEANAAREAACVGDRATVEAFLRACGHRSASLDYAAPTWAEIAPFGSFESSPDSTGEKDFYASVIPAKAGIQRPEIADCANALNSRMRGDDDTSVSTELDSTHRTFAMTSPQSRNVLARLLEMREEQRFHWERILARQRALLLSAGRALAAKGLLTDQNDIFWLEWNEVQRALTEAIAPDPICIAQRRRAHRINVPVRRPTHIAPGFVDCAMENGTKTLHGVGASSGIACGRAFVVHQLKDLPESVPAGAIFVLPCLDPAWTPVLRHVACLVIERGGLLSHAAIIAREYGIPLVIGVPEATERIKTGDVIQVDGDGGTVECE